MIKLVIQSGPLEGRVFVPPPGTEVWIGRSKGCFVCLDSGKVSRKHAVLVPRGGRYAIRDAGSCNGTFVNAEKVGERTLRSGDTIRIGEFEIAFLREDQDPWVGKIVAGYRILERIGSGGMGTVYRAHQVAMDRPVALKILSEELGGNAAFVSRFVDEARAMAKVSHPHVVQVHNVGQHQNVFYLSMEYLEGGSLKDLLDREGPLPPKKAASLILDATQALIWAAERGIVHRDIKPGNLLLDASGRVQVGDFGLAADLRRDQADRDAGQILGSPHFMAPEQALGRPVDQRADVYAMGSTLYVALCGKNPFPGRTVKDVIVAKLKGEAIPISKVAPGAPAAIRQVVEKAMARNPGDRYQSAKELHDALSQAARALDAPAASPRSRAKTKPHARPAGGGAPRAPLRSSRVRRSHLSGPAVVGCVAGACVLGGILVWAFLGEGGSQVGTGAGNSGEGGISGSASPASGTQTVSEQAGGKTSAAPAEARGSDGTPAVPPEVATGDERRETSVPARDSSAEKPATAEPATAPKLPEELLAEVDLFVLEGRFEEARSRLDQHQAGHASEKDLVKQELERVRGAETLLEAVRRAGELKAAGDVEGARKEIERVAPGLPEPYRADARKWINAHGGH